MGAGRKVGIWHEVCYKAGGEEFGGMGGEWRCAVSLPASLAGAAVGSQVLCAGVGGYDKIMSKRGKFGGGDLRGPLEIGTGGK